MPKASVVRELTEGRNERAAADEFGRVCVLVVAGTAVACLAVWRLCEPPLFPRLTWATLLARCAGFLLITACTGALGMNFAWLLMSPRPLLRRRRMFWHALAGWVFLPGIVLLSAVKPVWALVAGVSAAAVMAVSLRRLAPIAVTEESALRGEQDGPAFRELPATGFRPMRALCIAMCMQGALVCGVTGHGAGSGVLLAAAMFLLLWHWSADTGTSLNERQNRGMLRGAAALGLIACVLALLPWLAQWRGGRIATGVPVRAQAAERRMVQSHYTSVILWPPRNA